MPDSFIQILAFDGHANSLGRSSEVIEVVLQNQSRLSELLECTQADDAWVRMRAIDAIEKICRVHPSWIEPHVDFLISELCPSNQSSIQWHLAQIFTQVKLTPSQAKLALAWLESRLSTLDVDWIVAANTMSALMHFSQTNQYSSQKLSRLLKDMEQHHSKSVVRRSLKLQQELNSSQR